MKVAILDDSKMVTSILKKDLKGIVEVVEFNSVREFLQDVRINSYDLIFIDINMPQRNGLDVINEIKDYPHLINSKIVVITAEESDVYKEIAKMLGVKAYMKKPFSKETIQKVVNKLLGLENEI